MRWNQVLRDPKKTKEILFRKEKEALHQDSSRHRSKRPKNLKNQLRKRKETRFPFVQRIKFNYTNRCKNTGRYWISRYSKNTSKLNHSDQEKKRRDTNNRAKEIQSPTFF